MSEENKGTGPVFVKFGELPNQQIPVEWAEKMLTDLKASNGPLFGKLLQVALGIEQKARKPREGNGTSAGTGTPGTAQQPGRFGRR